MIIKLSNSPVVILQNLTTIFMNSFDGFFICVKQLTSKRKGIIIVCTVNR